MPIPEFQAFMLPIMQFASDGQVHTLAEAREALAAALHVTDLERQELLPSGRQSRFDNRVAWAKVHLHHAGLLSSPQRGRFSITDRGREVLAKAPLRIDLRLLSQFEEYRQFRSRSSGDGPVGIEVVETPEERLEEAFQVIRSQLSSELLEKVKNGTPAFFERLVVELLIRMGYGGNRAEAGKAIGASGDEGIDGVISEDRLGLDTIYLQAKKWEGTVGRPEIQKFVGALHGKRARKGVFITTGTFSSDAKDYVSRIDPRVVLIDGEQLTEYMIDFGLGVTTRTTYELKKLDSDYFEGDA